MAQRSTIPPAGYMIGTGARGDGGNELGYFVLARDPASLPGTRGGVCWRVIAGPYVRRGGAVQRMNGLIVQAMRASERAAGDITER